jgi:hypothetical protein
LNLGNEYSITDESCGVAQGFLIKNLLEISI